MVCRPGWCSIHICRLHSHLSPAHWLLQYTGEAFGISPASNPCCCNTQRPCANPHGLHDRTSSYRPPTPIDNVSFTTHIHTLLQFLHLSGSSVTLNWLPSHARFASNEAEDTAAKEALLLPTITAPIPSSLSASTALLRRTFHATLRQELAAEIANASPSARWYATATNYCRRQFLHAVSRSDCAALHRLYLVYRCFSGLHSENVVVRESEHSGEDHGAMLLHLLYCPTAYNIIHTIAG